MPLDLESVQPDFMVAVGYKWLLGPLGLSYLYVAEPHRGGEPLEENWIVRAGSEDFARLVDYRDDYQPGARRYDFGQRTSFTLVPMAAAALTQVLDWGVDQIAASLAAVTDRAAGSAAAHGLEPLPADARGPHLLGLRLPDAALGAVLPALAEANCFAAVRSTSLRLAPHLHVNEADVERLFGALAGVV
jgi:selenocysteine lyase/cysteine desulfurase